MAGRSAFISYHDGCYLFIVIGEAASPTFAPVTCDELLCTPRHTSRIMHRYFQKSAAYQPSKLPRTSELEVRYLPNWECLSSSLVAALSTTRLTSTHGSKNISAEGGPERKVKHNGP